MSNAEEGRQQGSGAWPDSGIETVANCTPYGGAGDKKGAQAGKRRREHRIMNAGGETKNGDAGGHYLMGNTDD
jgi:hypothetical protein